MTIQTYRPTLNAGQVYLRVAGSAAPLVAIGNVSALTIEISEDEKTLTDHTRPGGGQWASVSRVTGVTAGMTLHDLDPTNLSRAIYGDTAAVVGGTVAAETHTAYQGGLIRLDHPNPTAVTITGSVAGVDYEVRPEGIMILEGNIEDADEISVAYTYAGYDMVQALTAGSKTYEMTFGGLNEANSNSPVVLDIFRLQIGAASNLSLIGDDFAALEVKGKVLMDSSKTGSGISRYFRVQMAA